MRTGINHLQTGCPIPGLMECRPTLLTACSQEGHRRLLITVRAACHAVWEAPQVYSSVPIPQLGWSRDSTELMVNSVLTASPDVTQCLGVGCFKGHGHCPGGRSAPRRRRVREAASTSAWGWLLSMVSGVNMKKLHARQNRRRRQPVRPGSQVDARHDADASISPPGRECERHPRSPLPAVSSCLHGRGPGLVPPP